MERHTLKNAGALLVIAAFVLLLIGLGLLGRARRRETDQGTRRDAAADTTALTALHLPVRPEPDAFPVGTHLPDLREGHVSGSVDPDCFSPGRDLTYIDDARVWWESDQDRDDSEDDHTIHRAAEVPIRRLIEMVCRLGGTLEVQDAYRPAGIHNPRSLHREGRAVDLTCDELGLEKLAKLCWAAGFDWVFHENGKGGAHVHASVRPDNGATDSTPVIAAD